MKIQQEQNSQADHHQLVIADQNRQHLPTAEVREVVPEFDDEIDLREYLEVLVRRKWAILTFMLLCFLLVTIYTLAMTPQFQAKGVLRVSAQAAKLTSFENLESTALKTLEFQQTQVRMLQSEQLAGRVIDTLALDRNPTFGISGIEVESGENDGRYFKGVTNFIRRDWAAASGTVLNEESKRQLRQHDLLNKFKAGFIVSPVRNSEMIEVSFATPDPVLSSDIVNSVMDEFIDMHLDFHVQNSGDAARFLEKQISAAQIKLEKSELDLQEFARKIGVVSLDPKLNMVLRQMEELNDALAKARATRIAMEARYQRSLLADGDNPVKIIENELIQSLKNQIAALDAEYKELAITFKPKYPQMQQLNARMVELRQRIDQEKKAIIDSIQDDYQTALKTESYLQERTEEQKKRALDLEAKATQYKIYQREVESNKSVYQSLLQRAKEIDATVGAAVTNIQVVDRARPPLYPFKPRVMINLLLGIVLGAFGGIGLAFVLEYFDNTIKHPDEMSERLRIPVLGLIPYDAESNNDRKSMALKFFNAPRSPVAEAFRTTMTSVRLSSADKQPKTILFTSILAGAGKSSLSCNACFSCLAEDERCLLIDVDLRKPSLHKIFNGGERGEGLSSILTGMAKLEDVIIQTEYENLDFIACGPLPPNPAELLSSKRMRRLLGFVAGRYDRIILDGPPYQGFAEVLVLANMVDGVIVVAEQGGTPREGVKQLRKAIENVRGNILGSIFNKVGIRKTFNSYADYSSYSYSYAYGKEEKIDVPG